MGETAGEIAIIKKELENLRYQLMERDFEIIKLTCRVKELEGVKVDLEPKPARSYDAFFVIDEIEKEKKSEQS